jgi:hypothetical protein
VISFNKILREAKAQEIGTCKDIGKLDNLPWNDATELAQDLGYYATFDDFEDPEDSNYKEITSKEFAKNCDYFLPKHHYIFLKHKEKSIFIAYDKDTDTHHVYI